MNSIDALDLALEHLAEHKLRTALTTLGMMFGVGSVIAMLSIGAGAEREALALIEQLGVHNVVVRAKALDREELLEVRKKSLGLSERDMFALRESVSEAKMILPKVEVDTYQVIAAHVRTKAHVYGVSHRHFMATPISVGQGRFFDTRDELDHAQVAVIGADIRRSLFGTNAAIGQPVKINNVWLEVVGVMDAERAKDQTIEDITVFSSARAIYVPYTTAVRKFDRDALESPLSEIVIRVDDDRSPSRVGMVVENLLNRLHAGAEDFEVIVPEALMRQSRETQRLFSLVMGLIAGISLLVGSIGIMNIMLASVLEQTAEIGIRRAVGATAGDILYQFLATAFTLALLGGMAGVVLGVGISFGVAAYAGWPTLVTAASVGLSLTVCVAVGIASGLYPAVRAARLDPIEALHWE